MPPLRRIDPRRVLVNVISKSGGTAETMAQYLVVRAMARRRPRRARRPGTWCSPPIRRAGRSASSPPREGIATLEVPPDVGGRFSVLSPVGLLPAALVGIDVAGLLAGARQAIQAADTDDLARNPAALYAALHWAADAELERPDQRAHAVHRPAPRVRRMVSAALGREPGQAGGPWRAGRCIGVPPRSGRWAPPTSTARSSSSWKDHTTRPSPSSWWTTSGWT